MRHRIMARDHAIELMRLNNAKEQKRLALKVGKKGLYAWIYGEKSFWAKTIIGKTWQELGVSGWEEGYTKMVEGLRKIQEMTA